MIKKIKKIKFSDGFLFFLILINVLPVLAPIFMKLGFIGPAKVIYFIFSFTCHQMHWRSLHVFDYQVAWCARDMGVWAGMLLIALIYKKYRIKGLKFYYFIPFILPMALDGGIQTIATAIGLSDNTPFYISNNFMRFFTGSIFGMGMGAILLPMVNVFETDKLISYQELVKKSYLKKIYDFFYFIKPKLYHLFIFCLVFLISYYFVFIQIWNLTSQDYKPSNVIDSAVKLPSTETFIIERRKNAVCPVLINSSSQENDMLSLDCFLKGEDSK